TRYYAENALALLPLRCAPDPAKIESAAIAIETNTAYLASIPKRVTPLRISVFMDIKFGTVDTAFGTAVSELHLPPVENSP
ncbi:MAG: hypothetical protein Q8S92_20860, partial [Hydrogenophaga sp.]